MGVKEDLSGKRFGRLTVIAEAPHYKGRTAWLCRCDCGNKTIVISKRLKNGMTKSCGCLSSDVTAQRNRDNTKHGMCDDRLYQHWNSMLNRCRCPHNASYKSYGGRGISVCKEWETNFESFMKWSLMNGYLPSLSLDRIDVNGNYEPSNCRWVNQKVQANNRRNTFYLTAFGETKPIQIWANEYGISATCIRNRLKRGMTTKDAISKPSMRKKT